MRRNEGFSLVELMIAIAILVILAGIGIPNFRDMILNNRIASQSNGMLGVLQMARSEAVTRRATITVCPSSDQTTCTADTEWQDGVVVLQLADVLRTLPAAPGDVEVNNLDGDIFITYDSTGRPVSGNTRFSIEDDRGPGALSRTLCLNLLGQTSIIRGDQACP
jgi:type IV fimbrial biogenesis protein FimT